MIPKLLFLLGYLFFFLALLLPYIVYDQFIFQPDVTTPASFGAAMELVKGATLPSYKTLLGYLSIIWMIYPLLKVLQDSKGAYKQVMLSAIVLLSIHSILYYGITRDPSWMNGYLNVRLSLGFWINVYGAIICFLSGLLMLLRLIQKSKLNQENNELLDDSI